MKILSKVKKALSLGMILGGLFVAPSFANEIENGNTLVDNTVVEITMDTNAKDNTRVEDSISLGTLALELNGKTFSSMEELVNFCNQNGFKYTNNTEKDSLNGESHFVILICGTELKAEVVVVPEVQGVEDEIIEEEVEEVEEEVNYDDLVTTLPDDVLVEEEVNNDDLVVTLPDDVLVEEEVNNDDLVVTLPDDVLVEEDVNNDDLVVTLPDDVLVEEDVTVVPGPVMDNNTVTPEVDDVVAVPGPVMDNNTVTPEVDDVVAVPGPVMDNNTVTPEVEDVVAVPGPVMDNNTVTPEVEDVTVVPGPVMDNNTVTPEVEDVTVVPGPVIDNNTVTPEEEVSEVKGIEDEIEETKGVQYEKPATTISKMQSKATSTMQYDDFLINPKTGDTSVLSIYLIGILLSVSSLFILNKKRCK